MHRTRAARILSLCAVCLLTAATPYRVRLDAAKCTQASTGDIASLGPDWTAVAEYVQQCPVHGPDGQVALTVFIVRLDRMYRINYFAQHREQIVPTPVLRTPDGRMIGDLGEGFPIDPPGRMKVTFADWRNGFPWRIDRYEAGESALSPHQLDPLKWNATTQRYGVTVGQP